MKSEAITYMDRTDMTAELAASADRTDRTEAKASAGAFRWHSSPHGTVRQMTDFAVLELTADALERFQAPVVPDTAPVTLSPCLMLKDSAFHGVQARVQFRIGRNKRYVLKDIGRFLEAFIEGRTTVYGKDLVLTHTADAFDTPSRTLLDFLKTSYTREGNRALGRFYDAGGPYEKYLYLSAGMLDGLMACALTEKALDIALDGGERIRVAVTAKLPPLELDLTKKGNAWVLIQERPFLLLEGCEHIGLLDLDGADRTLFCVPPAISCRLRAFLKKLTAGKGTLTLLEEDMPAFYTAVLRPLLPWLTLRGGEALIGFEPPAMTASLYLDSLLQSASGIRYERDDAFRELVQAMDHADDVTMTVPENLEAVLRPYQKTGFRWLKTLASHGFGGILADDMGLGKTLQIIALLADAYSPPAVPAPSLVVCPASLVENWYRECRRFAGELDCRVITGNQAERRRRFDAAGSADVLITSYDLLRRDVHWYSSRCFQYLIIDEAQAVKNHRTQAARAVRAVPSLSRFALTGTPIENSLAEFWAVFDFLMPGYLYPYARFRRRFEEPIVRRRDSQALEALKQLTAPFILRRMKQDVLPELPDKIETTLYIPLTGIQKKLYDRTLRQMQTRLWHDKTQNRIALLAMLTRLRQICCDPALIDPDLAAHSAKGTCCIELIEKAVASGHRILVFSQFTSVFAFLEKRLKDRGIAAFTLTGQTPAARRLDLVTRFQEGDTPVFLISLKAGGTGLNLTAADVVIHYDPWWNSSVKQQATDRACRIGQKNSVQVYNLIAENTIEEKIETLQARKADLAAAVVTPEDFSSLTQEMLTALFE